MTFFLQRRRGATNGVGKEIAGVLANRGEYVIKTIENTNKGDEMKVDVYNQKETEHKTYV